MSHGQKKFLYGLFYLIILGLIIWTMFPATNNTAPPVCPGPSCGTNQPLPLQLANPAQIFKSESTHRVVLLASVQNPNADYGANIFSYEFSISKKDGGLITKLSGSDNIYPDETKYLIGFYNASGADLSTIADQLDFKISRTDFRPAAEFLKPDLVLTSAPLTQINPDNIKVIGQVKNQSPSLMRQVKIVAVLGNKYGDPVFAAQTLVQPLNAFQEIPFEVSFPADRSISQSLDVQKTQVFFYGE